MDPNLFAQSFYQALLLTSFAILPWSFRSSNPQNHPGQ